MQGAPNFLDLGLNLDREAALNLKAHLDQVMRAFEARDYDGAIRKLGAAAACIERVKARPRR